METKMANRLSYSQIRLYNECAKRYEYHYVEKFREITKSGALVFGSALDKALDPMVTSQDFPAALAIYESCMKTDVLNGVTIDVPVSEYMVYSKTDYDADVLTDEDVAAIKAFNPSLSVSEIANKKEGVGHWGLTKDERIFFNYANWTSLRRKGLYLLDTLWKEVVPNIKEVIALQKKIELKNGSGDTVLGYADLICRWIDGRILLLDLKTAGRPYDGDSVKVSQQLAIYDEALAQEGIKVDGYGYIVLLKQLKIDRTKTCTVCEYVAEKGSRHKTCSNEASGKRCGGEWTEIRNVRGEVQYVIDNIPQRSKDIILDNVSEVNYAITQKVFPRNFNACEGKFGRCPFYNKCWKDDDKDLVKVN